MVRAVEYWVLESDKSFCRPKMAALATFVRSRKARRYRTESAGMTLRSILVRSFLSVTPGGRTAVSPFLYPAAGCARSGS